MDGHEVAQDERPGQPFVVDIVFQGIGDDRHAGGDALVAAAAVAHGRQGAARHPGVRCRRRHAHGETQEIVPEDLLLVLPDGFPHAHAVVSGQAFPGQCQIEGAVFQDKGNVGKGGVVCEIQDFPDRWRVFPLVRSGEAGGRFGTHQDPVCKASFHDAVVVVFDDGVGLGIHFGAGLGLPVGADGGFDVEQVVGIRHGNGYFLALYQFQRPFYGHIGHVGQDFQVAAGIAADGPQGGGHRQAHAPRSGDAHAHSVFEDIAAHGHVDAKIGRQPPAFRAAGGAVVGDDFYRLGNGQGHRDGFRATQGGLHFAVEKGNNLFRVHTICKYNQ